MVFLVRAGSIASGAVGSGSVGSGAASSTIRRSPWAVSGAARANRRQYSKISPVILAVAAAARPTVIHAEDCASARVWRWITATTRSTTAASAMGAMAYAAIERALASLAADTFM